MGDETVKTGHHFNAGSVTTQPTYISKGLRTYTCTSCGVTYDEDVDMLTQTDLSECGISLSYTSCTWSGKEKKPTVTVKTDSEIVPAEEYSVTYADNVNAGTATVTITAGEGNVRITGSVTRTFKINKKKQVLTADLSEEELHINSTAAITADGIGTIAYTSADPSVAAISENGIVTAVSAGTTEITVTAAGDANHASAAIVLPVNVTDHITGDAISSTKTVSSGDIICTETYVCSICSEVVSTSEKIIYTIKSSKCTTSLSRSSYTWNGTAFKPVVTVTYNGITLVKGKDYTVHYKNNTNAGVAQAIITGIGNYTGNVKESFVIRKASQAISTAVSSKTYSSSAVQTASRSFNIGASAKTSLTYAVNSYPNGGRSYIHVSTDGKVVIVKGAPKGTYKVTVTAAANAYYNSAKKTVTITIK